MIGRLEGCPKQALDNDTKLRENDRLIPFHFRVSPGCCHRKCAFWRVINKGGCLKGTSHTERENDASYLVFTYIQVVATTYVRPCKGAHRSSQPQVPHVHRPIPAARHQDLRTTVSTCVGSALRERSVTSWPAEIPCRVSPLLKPAAGSTGFYCSIPAARHQKVQ